MPINLISDPHQGWPISQISWSHNNKIIASCSSNDNTICLFKASDGKLLSTFSVCSGGVSLTDVAFSTNSTLLAYGCDDGVVGIWHI